MADPTLTELLTQVKNRCALFEKVRLAGKSQSQNIVGLYQTDVDAVKGDYSAQSLSVLDRLRKNYAATISDAAVKEGLAPIVKMLGIYVSSQKTDVDAIAGDVVKYFAEYGRAAQGTLTLDTNPTDADTMTLGAVTYRFKSTMASANDIKLGATLADTQASIIKTINGTGLAGTDYYAGTTTPHTTVKCGDAFASNILTLTARTVGTAGNSLASTETFTAGSNVFNAATLGTTTAGVDQITFASRAFSFGSVTAGRLDGSSNVGGGTVLRLTKDEYGNTIESSYGADTVTITCTQAEQEGAGAHEEVFEIESKMAGVDPITERGSGLKTPGMKGASARSAGNLIVDASFSSLLPATDGSAVTSMTGWVTSDGSYNDLKVSMGAAGTDFYRVAGPGETTAKAKALQIDAVRTLYQQIRSNVDASKPYLIQCAVLPLSADGVCRINIRSYETPASPGTILATSGWVTVTGSSWLFPRIPLDASCWPKTWMNGNRVAVEFIWSGRTTGSILLDDWIFEPMTKHDTLHYVALGTAVKAAKGDRFTFADTETGASNTRWFTRGFKRNVPTTSGTPTIADATVT